MMSSVFERLPELVNDDADLVRRGRFLTVTFLVTSGATQYLVGVVERRIAAFRTYLLPVLEEIRARVARA